MRRRNRSTRRTPVRRTLPDVARRTVRSGTPRCIPARTKRRGTRPSSADRHGGFANGDCAVHSRCDWLRAGCGHHRERPLQNSGHDLLIYCETVSEWVRGATRATLIVIGWNAREQRTHC